MSNKLSKADKQRRKSSNAWMETAVHTMEYLLAAVVSAVCTVVPLYARDGYHQIGNAKFEAYRRIMIGGFSVLLIMSTAYCIWRIRKIGTDRRVKKEKEVKSNRGEKWKRRVNSNKEIKSSDGSISRILSRLSSTDKFVLTYLLLTGISVVSGGFYEDALWGVFGWNMGLLSQLSFVLLYIFLSRLGRYYRVILAVLCTVASAVFAIGILHRLMIDPIGFYDGLTYEQKAQFLSTLGQATWYAAYLAVTLPVGIGVFLYGTGKKWRILSGIYMMLGFCTAVTQNSDSAYFALAGAMLVFFIISLEKKETLRRLLAALTMFFGAGKLMYLLTRMRPNPALIPDFVTELMWTSWLTWVLFIVCLAFTLLLYLPVPKNRCLAGSIHSNCIDNINCTYQKKQTAQAGRKTQANCMAQTDQTAQADRKDQADWIPASIIRLIRRGIIGAVIGLAAMAVLIIYLQSQGALPESIADRVSAISYLSWSDDWGNGRGRIWSFTGRVIAEESPGHRLFGVGPDCFNSYVNAYHGEEEALLWGEKKLTNAHNEWLNMLVNGGILGAAAYVGIYVTAIGRFLRGNRKNFLLTGIAASCVSYMCYNFFCYQQVLCTPFVFILMGIGEYIMIPVCRERS